MSLSMEISLRHLKDISCQLGGFYCNRLEIKHLKKCLKMLTIFHAYHFSRPLNYKHPELSVAY